MTNDLTPTEVRPPKPIRLNKQKLMFMDLWTNPQNKTFGNVYQSGLAAGFSPTYSRNLMNAAPKWLVSFIDKMELEEEHIKQGIQNIATGQINSKSVDDTRLKAYELLMKLKGLGNDTHNTNITLVQPILNGASVPKHIDNNPPKGNK